MLLNNGYLSYSAVPTVPELILLFLAIPDVDVFVLLVHDALTVLGLMGSHTHLPDVICFAADDNAAGSADVKATP